MHLYIVHCKPITAPEKGGTWLETAIDEKGSSMDEVKDSQFSEPRYAELVKFQTACS